MTQKIEGNSYFGASVYTVDMPDFLDSAIEVADEFLKENKQEINEIYPVKMTGNMFMDKRMDPLCHFAANSARAILDDQGYNINLFNMYFSEMWTQQHYKGSGMDHHVHGQGTQITGFYFLEVPKDSSRVIFHDSNVGKLLTGLPEKDVSKVTASSTMINFEPKVGQFMFTNAWLPHSFTKNNSEQPFKFIHFNLGVELLPQQLPDIEVV